MQENLDLESEQQKILNTAFHWLVFNFQFVS